MREWRGREGFSKKKKKTFWVPRQTDHVRMTKSPRNETPTGVRLKIFFEHPIACFVYLVLKPDLPFQAECKQSSQWSRGRERKQQKKKKLLLALFPLLYSSLSNHQHVPPFHGYQLKLPAPETRIAISSASGLFAKLSVSSTAVAYAQAPSSYILVVLL